MVKGRDANGRFAKGNQIAKGNGGGGRPKGNYGLEMFLVDGIDISELRSLQETEVRERFRILNELYNWFEVVHSQEGFPDFVLRNGSDDIIRAEAEVEAKTFLLHGHAINECDLLICWRHNWPKCPLPVLVLSVEWANYQTLKAVRPYSIGNETTGLTRAKRGWRTEET